MQKVIIYHNPRCSKSRQTLGLLEQHGVEPKIVEYLNTPPSTAELKKLCKLLDISPRELLRKNEADYKEQDLKNTELTDKDILQAMHEFPKLIQRPIVINGDKAVLGRPPENVLEIL